MGRSSPLSGCVDACEGGTTQAPTVWGPTSQAAVVGEQAGQLGVEEKKMSR